MNKYYRVYAQIDLDAICHNIAEIKRLIGNDTKIMPVIKADGYGHGAVAIAKTLRENVGVDAFAVATVEEGIEVRNAGVEEPILILGYSSPLQYDLLLQYEIMPAIFRYEDAKQFSNLAVSMGKNSKIHIKLDTGMNRIGFQPTQESLSIVEDISKLPNLTIDGLFTHFACADEADKTSAKQQRIRYDWFVSQLEQRHINIPVKHVSNSASILDLEENRMDMVRSGIITYGLYPSDEVNKKIINLKPALSWKSTIVHIKELEAGQGISYNATYVTDHKMKIATIPVGYADGYPRVLSSRGRVLIRGQFAPIVGRICMDQFMVDVSHIKNVSVMDEVTLIGTDGECTLPVEEIATLAGTINYEIVCDIGKRVPRIYLEKGKKLCE